MSTLGWVSRLSGWLLIAAAVCVAVLVVVSAGPILGGRKTLIVMGGSMEPTIPVGSVVVSEAVRANRLQVGDVISYVSRSEQIVTHRITEVVQDQSGIGFRTRGDANNAPDPELVRPVNVLGRVWYSVPLAGYILHFGNQTATKVVVIAIALALITAVQLQSYVQRRRASAPASEAPKALRPSDRMPVAGEAGLAATSRGPPATTARPRSRLASALRRRGTDSRGGA